MRKSWILTKAIAIAVAGMVFFLVANEFESDSVYYWIFFIIGVVLVLNPAVTYWISVFNKIELEKNEENTEHTEA